MVSWHCPEKTQFPELVMQTGRLYGLDECLEPAGLPERAAPIACESVLLR